MENIFVDVNVLVDVLGDRKYGFENMLDNQTITLSALTFHIIMYVKKFKVPNGLVNSYCKSSTIIALNRNILRKSLVGPTSDFEDNVQLHSAVEGECDCFLTKDKQLLEMKYFGKVKICDRLE